MAAAEPGGEVPTTASRLRTLLNRYAFALACGVLGVAGLILIGQDDNLTAAQFASAVGINLVASVVFAFVFTYLSTRVQERNLLETLGDEFAAQDRKISELMHTMSTQFVPSRTYLAVPEFDRQFNRDLSNSLNNSHRYGFRGTSAKYVPARIERCNRPLDVVRIVMLDPDNEGALGRRAVERKRQTPHRDKTVESLISEIRNEILMSTVALFDIRHICPVEIIVVDEPIITRMEIFDDAIYLSWYQGPESGSHPFPESVRFNAGSFVYETERLNLETSFARADRITRFDPGLTADSIISSISGLAGTAVTQPDIDNWRKEYQQFIPPFHDMLAHL